MQQKATWMRHLIIGIVSSFFVSCGGEIIGEPPLPDPVYTYINKSKYPISIEKWKNGTKKVFSLPVLDSIVQEEAYSFAEVNDLILNADSLDIIFDNSKKLSLTLKGNTISTNNILWLGNYKKITDDGHKYYYYTYTFSNIDYDSAVDCNSNCN